MYNCIHWNNNTSTGLEQLAGYDDTWFCCRNDPNNPAGSATPDARGNISCEPGFAYHTSNYGNYHLEPASPCIDAGGANSVVDPNGFGEYDIDAGDRIVGDRVDMGADEVACENVFHPVDLTTDGLVNLVEYDLIAAAWLSEDPNASCQPADPNRTDHWDRRCDLDKDDVIDLADLVLFYDAWLWRACWRSSPQAAWMYSPPAAADPNQ